MNELIDPAALRNDFYLSQAKASERAEWSVKDCPANKCRYCGKPWRVWAGSKLDGHAKCIVTEDYKQTLRVLLSSPKVTYQEVADVIGVSSSVLRSWASPMRQSR
jgi:hypothetical protein